MSVEPLLELKQLARYQVYLKGTVDFKRKIIAVIDQLYPEYESVFYKAEIFGKASKQVLYELSSPVATDAIQQKNWRSFYLNIVVVTYG